jgi:hypothetical protein
VINPIFNQSWDTKVFGDCVYDLIEQWKNKCDDGEVSIQDKIQR